MMIVAHNFFFSPGYVMEHLSTREYPNLHEYTRRTIGRTVDAIKPGLVKRGGAWMVENGKLHVVVDTSKMEDGINHVCNTIWREKESIPVIMSHMEKYIRKWKLEKILQ